MTSSAAPRRSLVTCRAAGELLALDVGSVERVLRYTVPRTLPNTAAWMRGVIAVGEQLVTVLDLRERLGLSAAAAHEGSRIVVLALSGGRIGFVVDAVDDVVAVDPAMIEAAPPVYRGLARAFVQGILRRDERLYLVLDADHLVTSQERLALGAAVEELQHGR
ncbi:chemotaxis protein CheW [Pseudogemmatithrix spongiicola]|uniref:Chemotaxis protein CheW n=1 Tax=Pseudogemmatithrix spongiicola TaxID=3062599 RepID=A0AA49JZP1_9BACT|nr:chemotaxis protein CheW [Gemmatimonadaceae bacterium 'strain 138']WKW14901.1 chemotaxis protein CheW [Gemmatimonadaceae bacterium 'strain 318']